MKKTIEGEVAMVQIPPDVDPRVFRLTSRRPLPPCPGGDARSAVRGPELLLPDLAHQPPAPFSDLLERMADRNSRNDGDIA